MSKPLLEFKNLVTEFETEGNILKAVNNVSFTLNKGETIGIVGESGSGKSVTSLSSMRLIPNPPGRISNGEIIYHAKDNKKIDLVQISEKEMRTYRGNDLAMIFQEPMTSLNPVFTCGDQVMEAIMLHQDITVKEAKALTISLFEEVQLPDPERIFSWRETCPLIQRKLEAAQKIVRLFTEDWGCPVVELELHPNDLL